MSKLYIWASVCFELTLYLWLYASYIDFEGRLLVVIALTFLISIILLAIPSGYHIREWGFNIGFKRLDLLGYLKLMQLFVFFILMPALGKEKIIFSVLILGFLSVINWVNQLIIYKQIKEQVSNEKLINKVLNQTDKEMKNSALVSMAWKTIIPLFLWGLMVENNVLVNLLVFMVILLIEARLIYKFYINATKQIDKTSFKKDFMRTLYRVIIAFIVLIIMSIFYPTNLFSYFIIGFIPVQFVNLIFRQTLKKEKSHSQQINL